MTHDELTTAQVCKMLGRDRPLNRSTVSRWVQIGRLKARRLPNGMFMFDPAEVESLSAEIASEKESAAA